MNHRLCILILAGSGLTAGCSFDGLGEARSPDGAQTTVAPGSETTPGATPGDASKKERSPIDELAPKERDPRRHAAVRSEALLDTEAKALESLLESTSETSPDRPTLLLRLAESEAELARAEDATDAERGHQAHARAAESYAKIATGKGSQIDEALYYAAYESELAGDLTHARERYLALVRQYPASKFQPYVYVAFGELARARIATDPPAIDVAEKAYKEAAQYKDSKIRPFALFRWAEALDKHGDTEQAADVYRTLTTECGDSPEAALVPKEGAPSPSKPAGPEGEPSPWM